MFTRSHWTWFTAATTVAVVTSMVAFSTKTTRAASDDDSESKIKRGFEIAPVKLNLAGKNLGKRIVLPNVGEGLIGIKRDPRLIS